MRQCCPACTSTQSPDPFFRCGWLFTFPVTDFQAIPAGILKEDGVVARFLVERALNIPCAGAYDKRGEPLDFAQTCRPKTRHDIHWRYAVATPSLPQTPSRHPFPRPRTAAILRL